jgi:hypothetical protein
MLVERVTRPHSATDCAKILIIHHQDGVLRSPTRLLAYN